MDPADPVEVVRQQPNAVTQDLNNVQTFLALLTQESQDQRDEKKQGDITFTDAQCKP